MPEFFGEFSKIDSETTIQKPDTIKLNQDPLNLKISDVELVRNIDSRIRASKKFYNGKKNLDARRKTNKDYLFGNQIRHEDLKYYNARYMDNVIYESQGTIKPIALSRLPDLLVNPAKDDNDSIESAKNLTDIINNDIRKRDNRRVLGLAFKHFPVYYVGAIKPIWDPEIGDQGDYRFRVVHPENLVLDHTASTNDPADMSYVAESIEMSVKEATMMFPEKTEELMQVAGVGRKTTNKEELMASPIKLWEVWFKWPEKSTDPETGESKWEMVYGVAWKYRDLLLKKMKNPYWDWTGEKRLFVKDPEGLRTPTDAELEQAIFGSDTEEIGFVQRQVFRNQFQDPRFPYIFLGYDQWGEMPLDETSSIEQVRLLQDNINKRGKQITEMNDRSKGKHVFSTEGGLEKTDIEEMDMNNPDEDILVDGDVGKVHTFIPGQPAPAQLFQEQELERQKAFAKMKTHSTTRGEKTSDVATTNQMLREADFGAIDDMVEDTINYAAEWMARWAMQFIRLFYTVEHVRQIVGKDGDTTFVTVNQDSVDNGMEVIVSASGVDKLQKKREAFEMARMKLIDPLTFYQDTGVSDPIGRTKKLMTFLQSPQVYFQQFIEKRDTMQQIDALAQVPTEQTPQPQIPTQAGGGQEGYVQLANDVNTDIQGVGGFGGGGNYS